MRSALAFALAALLVFAPIGCSKSSKKASETGGTGSSTFGYAPNKVLVKVDGRDITGRDLDQQAKMLIKQVEGRVDSAQLVSMMPTVKQQAVDNAINRVLIEQTVRKMNLMPAKERVDARIADYRKNFVSDEAFNEDVKKNGLDKESLRSEVEIGLAAESLFAMRTAKLKPVSAAEIKAFYDSNKDKFQQPEQVRASHILVKVEKDDAEAVRAQKREKAAKILADLKKGADFAEQAKLNSDDPSNKERGGDLGFFQHGQMVPEFESAAFALKVGAMSGVVETPFGFHIIKVTDRKTPQPVPFDQVKQNIEMYLSDKQKNDALSAYFDSLRNAAKVQFMDSSLVR